jgi:hypothetical protein
MAIELTPTIVGPSKQELGKTASGSVPIRAWYYNPTDDPPSHPHQYTPNREVSVEHLIELGVLTWTQIETEDYHTNEFLNNIKVDRSYNYGEVLTVAPDRLNNFEALTKKFFTEHLHEEEEIRFILDGIGTILLSTPKWSLTQLYLRLMCDNIHSHHFSAHIISGFSSIWY